jgi:uncharacterized membrane protein YfcA
LALALIVALAFTVEAALGFGATVIAVTLGAQFMALDDLLPALVPVNVLLSAWIVLRHGRHADRALMLRRVLPAMAPGMLAGLLLWRWAHASALLLALGAFVAALAAWELLRERVAASTASRPLPQAVEVLLLALAGVAHGLWGSGGPLVVYTAGRRVADKATFRATLTLLWLALGLVLCGQYAVQGLLGRESALLSALLLPSLALGLWAGERLHGRVPEVAFKRVVWVVLLVAAVVLVGRVG